MPWAKAYGIDCCCGDRLVIVILLDLAAYVKRRLQTRTIHSRGFDDQQPIFMVRILFKNEGTDAEVKNVVLKDAAVQHESDGNNTEHGE